MKRYFVYDNVTAHTKISFSKGKSMSEQLREERMRIEKSAIKAKPKEHKTGVPSIPIKHPNLFNALHYALQFTNPRRYTWNKIAEMANSQGYRNAKGQKWNGKKLGELVNKCKDMV